MNEEKERLEWGQRQAVIWRTVIIGLAALTALIFWLGRHGTP